MSSCPHLQCLSVRAGIEIQLSCPVTELRRAASESLSVSHHPTTSQQTELANDLCKLKLTNINIQRKLLQQDAAQEKNLSLDQALPSFGVAQHGQPPVETRQEVWLLPWAVGSGGITQLWTLSSKGMSLPGEVYLKDL